MMSQSTWRRAYAGAKVMAVAGVVAFGLASAPSAGAVTITGSLDGFENGAPIIDLLSGPHDFNASFVDADGAGTFTFNFQNFTGSSVLLSIIDATIVQNSSLFFTDGVTTTFGGAGNSKDTAQGVTEGFNLQALVGAGDSIALMFAWGDAVGGTNSAGDLVGPDIDFLMEASVVPLPAALVLFLSGLAGIGFLGRYNANRRREPELV